MNLRHFAVNFVLVTCCAVFASGCDTPRSETPTPTVVPVADATYTVQLAKNPNKDELAPGETIVLSVVVDDNVPLAEVRWQASVVGSGVPAGEFSQLTGQNVVFTAPDISVPTTVLITATSTIAAQVITSSLSLDVREPTVRSAIADSGAAIRLTNDDSADEYNASLSPDETLLLYDSNKTPNGRWQVVSQNMATGETHPVFSQGNSWQGRFSPDGQSVVLTSDFEGNREIYLVDLQNLAGYQRLTNNDSTDDYPSFSPDGNFIVFESDRGGNWGIYIMNTKGGEQHPIFDSPVDDRYPRFAPDGKTIVFQSSQTGNWEIYTKVLDDDSAPLRLTDNRARDAQPSFAPDGRHIVFETSRSGDYELYTMNADGTNQINLSNYPAANDQVPTFSPRGDSVVFQSTRNGTWDILELPFFAPPGD